MFSSALPSPGATAPALPLRVAKAKLIAMTGELSTIQQIGQCLGAHFELIACHDPRQALTLLNAHADVRLVIAEELQGMADSLSRVMEGARVRQPTATRILLSSPGDLTRVVAALHSGIAHRAVQKPINPRELLAAAAEAMPVA